MDAIDADLLVSSMLQSQSCEDYDSAMEPEDDISQLDVIDTERLIKQ